MWGVISYFIEVSSLPGAGYDIEIPLRAPCSHHRLTRLEPLILRGDVLHYRRRVVFLNPGVVDSGDPRGLCQGRAASRAGSSLHVEYPIVIAPHRAEALWILIHCHDEHYGCWSLEGKRVVGGVFNL